MTISDDFELTSVSGRITHVSRLGPLAELAGTWKGTGFNQIWRPFHGVPATQDRFLELNETIETLKFEAIPGEIPNRGLVQDDINLTGLTYLQQIKDAHAQGKKGPLPGIHVEPGIWLSIPATTDPNDPPTVTRMANIPHGTSFVAQGTSAVISGPPTFIKVDITPFVIGKPANLIPFPESTLTNVTQFRTPSNDIPNVTQAMVDNPNSVLSTGITGKNIISTTVLNVSTNNKTPPMNLNPPTSGGGTSNIAFLEGDSTGKKPNAQAAQVEATFWIEQIKMPDGHIQLQLQYSQKVLLNFNGLSWPHVSVATLTKQ